MRMPLAATVVFTALAGAIAPVCRVRASGFRRAAIRRRADVTRVAVACACSVAMTVSAAPTDPDATWGTNGVVTSLAGATQLLGLQPAADAGALVGISGPDGSSIIRLSAAGHLDGGFAGTGAIRARHAAALYLGGMGILSDGRISVLWQGAVRSGSPNDVVCDRVLGRYLASGHADPAFGTQGELPFLLSTCAFGHVLDSGGASYGFSNRGGMFPATFLVRVSVDGIPLPAVVPFSLSTFGMDSLTVDPADRLVAGLYRRNAARGPFIAGRSGLPAFGTAGEATFQFPGAASPQGAFGMADGRVVAFGTANAGSDLGAQPAIVRFAANGIADATFGTNGLVILPLARPGEQGAARVRVLGMPDERLLVVADGFGSAAGPSSRVVLARLLPDGRLDETFALGGVAELPLGDAQLARGRPTDVVDASPLVRPDGRILLPLTLRDGNGVETPALVQLAGGDLPMATRRAVEYFHAEYGHYFVSADAEEIAHLDATSAAGWQRTGLSFDVFASELPPQLPACRFWSDQAFAPKSSHFFTPYPGECAAVKLSLDWRFERNAFGLQLPVGAKDARDCAPGTSRLYRAYNNMKTGAPNHRYMTDPAILDAMIAQGWTMEGEASTRVFACLPAPATQ